MSDKMQSGLGPESVEAAIKLLTAAKQMGVQTFSLGEFSVTFAHDAQHSGAPVPSAPAVFSNPLDDPDMWLHTHQAAQK